MTKFADLNKRRVPTKKVVRIPLDGDARARRERLRTDIADARVAGAAFGGSLASPSVSRLEAELAEVERHMAEDVAEFTLVAIGAQRLETLKLEHPPTRRQKDEGASWNYTTLGHALIQACCVDPELSDDDLKTLVNEWEPWQVDQLVEAAWDVCNSRTVVRPLSNDDSGATPDSEES